jgi:hypothetical protein
MAKGYHLALCSSRAIVNRAAIERDETKESIEQRAGLVIGKEASYGCDLGKR